MCNSRVFNINNFQPALDFDVDWSSEKECIRRYFKREVLPLLEKGLRECGLYEGKPCANCYIYQAVCSHHESTRMYSFEDIKSSNSAWVLCLLPSMSYLDFVKYNPQLHNDLASNWYQRMDTFKWGLELAD
jgi:hypothetical protein